MQDNDPTKPSGDLSGSTGTGNDDTKKDIDAQSVETSEAQQLNALDASDLSDPRPATLEPIADRPFVRVNDFVARPAEPSRKGLFIGIGLLVAVILAVVGGFLYWYFTVRIADAEYEKADAVIAAMIESTDGIESGRKSLNNNSTKGRASVTTTATVKPVQSALERLSGSIEKIELARDKSTDYLMNQELLSRLTVINDDKTVNTVYATNKKAIEDYGKSADTYFKTAYVYAMMMDRCFTSGALTDFSDVAVVEDFDRQTKQCRDYLNQHKTVPATEFSKGAYEPVRELVITMITNMRVMMTTPPSSSAYKQAESKLLSLGKSLDNLDSTLKDRMQPTRNPITQLKALKKKIAERKSVFVR